MARRRRRRGCSSAALTLSTSHLGSWRVRPAAHSRTARCQFVMIYPHECALLLTLMQEAAVAMQRRCCCLRCYAETQATRDWAASTAISWLMGDRQQHSARARSNNRAAPLMKRQNYRVREFRIMIIISSAAKVVRRRRQRTIGRSHCGRASERSCLRARAGDYGRARR